MNFELKDPTPNTDDWIREKGIHKFSIIYLAIIIFFSVAYVFLFFVTLNIKKDEVVIQKNSLTDFGAYTYPELQ